MKIFTTFLTTSVAAMSLCSCVALKKMPEYPPIDVEVMESMVPQHGMLPIKLAFSIPEKYNNLNTGVQICPEITLIDGSRTQFLPKMVVEGSFHERFNERMGVCKPILNDSILQRARYDKDKNVYIYYAEIPYQSWFKDANFVIKMQGDAYTRQVPLNDLLISGRMYDLSPYISKEPKQKYFYWSELEKEEWIKSGNVDNQISEVSFPVSFSDINDKKEPKELHDFLDDLFTNPEIKDYKVNAIVANSPEGSFEFNSELAEDRKTAVENYLATLKLDPAKCRYEIIQEDWDGVLNEIDKLDLNHPDEIRQIILSTSDLDERESSIKRSYRSDWNKISKNCFPQLRKADITITSVFKGKDGFAKGEDGFTFEKNPLIDDFDLHNQMLDAVKDKNFPHAAEIADKMDSRILPEKVLCNKGTVYLMNDRYEDAVLVLKRAKSISEARYNLGLAYLLLEKYNEAENAFFGFYDLNAAIAKMYTGKYEEAIEILNMLPISAEKDALLKIAKNEIK